MGIVVKNNTVAVHSLSLVMQKATEESSSVIDTIVLMPGNNVVTEKQFNVLLNTPAFIERRNRGKYSVIEQDQKPKANTSDSEEPKEEEPITSLDSLKGYSNAKAIEIVKETYDLKALKDWFSEENPNNKKRSKVLKAIETQIESLEKTDED